MAARRLTRCTRPAARSCRSFGMSAWRATRPMHRIRNSRAPARCRGLDHGAWLPWHDPARPRAIPEPMTRESISAEVASTPLPAAPLDARRLGFDGVEDPWRPWLSDRPVLLGLHQSACRRIWRRPGPAAPDLQSRDHRGGAPRDRAGFPRSSCASRNGEEQQDYAARLATTPEELARFLVPLSTAGVDIFHCSQRRFWEPEFEGSGPGTSPALDQEAHRQAHHHRRQRVALSGDALSSLRGESSSATGIDDLLDRLESDELLDLVAVGRALLVDPAWTRQGAGGPLRRTAALLRARGARDALS